MAAADLLIRETILGVLKAKDINHNNTIHSSDFKKAIDDLGIPWGSPVIDSIMTYCNSGTNGYINLIPLETQLKRERDEFNIQLNKEKEKRVSANARIGVSTSTGFKEIPFRVDLANKQKKLVDKQSKLLKDNRDKIKQLYEKFAHHEISIDNVINELNDLSIEPTNDFKILIRQRQYDDISFAEFIRSLTIKDLTASNTATTAFSVNNNQSNSDIAAGVHYSDKYKKKQEETDYGLFNVRKRTMRNLEKPHAKISQEESKSLSNLLGIASSSNEYMQMASVTGLYAPASNATTNKSNSLINLKSSENTKQSIFYDNNANNTLFSTSHLSMITGTQDKNNNNIVNDINYSSEQKVLREQILVALRKLRSGEIQQSDFIDKIYKLGFDIPDSLLIEFKKMSSSGELNYKKCVLILDTTIFKSNTLYDRPSIDLISKVKDKLNQSILSNGSSMLIGLEKLFHEIDLDNSNSLSFQEFLLACRKLGINQKILNDNELQIVFNDFDKNGDGELQYDEFMQSLREELTGERRNIVRQAFQKVNRKGMPSIQLSELINAMNVSEHPEVILGNKSNDEVINEMVEYFSLDQIDGDSEPTVSVDRFMEYYTNISAFISDDNEFIRSVKSTWNLGDKAPAPPTLVKHNAFGTSGKPDEETPHVIFRNSVFNTQISSGDIIKWSQEPSQFETLGGLQGKLRKPLSAMNKELEDVGGQPIQKGITHKNQSSGHLYKWNNPDSHEELKSTIKTEMKAHGFNNIRSSNRSNQSTNNHIEWNMKTKQSNKNDIKIEIIDIPKKTIYEEPKPAGKSIKQSKHHDISIYPFARRKSENNQHWTKSKPFGTEIDEDDHEDDDDISTKVFKEKKGNNDMKTIPISLANIIKNKSNNNNSSNNKLISQSLSDIIKSKS